VIFTPLVYEFQPTHAPELTLGQNRASVCIELMVVGLLVGAFGWGLGSDIIGRRWAFNLTLCITGIWGTVAGSAPSFAAIATFAALWSVGVGGNLYAPFPTPLISGPSIRQSFSSFFQELTNGFSQSCQYGGHSDKSSEPS
jgi:MFS family permease